MHGLPRRRTPIARARFVATRLCLGCRRTIAYSRRRRTRSFVSAARSSAMYSSSVSLRETASPIPPSYHASPLLSATRTRGSRGGDEANRRPLRSRAGKEGRTAPRATDRTLHADRGYAHGGIADQVGSLTRTPCPNADPAALPRRCTPSIPSWPRRSRRPAETARESRGRRESRPLRRPPLRHLRRRRCRRSLISWTPSSWRPWRQTARSRRSFARCSSPRSRERARWAHGRGGREGGYEGRWQRAREGWHW